MNLRTHTRAIPALTDEQQTIIRRAQEGHNIVIEAVPGGSKTTTSIQIARATPSRRFLILTYNSALNASNRRRIREDGLTNTRSFTFHAFAMQYFNVASYTDDGMLEILDSDRHATKPLDFDALIIDEAQDMRPLFIRFAHHLLRYNKRRSLESVQFIIVGDRDQFLYEFRGADPTFMPECHTRFAIEPSRKWMWLPLSQTFRIPRMIVQSLQHGFWGMPRIRGGHRRTNSKIRYLICHPYSTGRDRIFFEIRFYLEQGYRPSDIFVVAPSNVFKNGPLRKLVNEITWMNIPVFCADRDNSTDGDDRIYRNKIVVGTYHSVKGLERKVVIVMGVDASYYQIIREQPNLDHIPNPLYVALTRCQERMTLVHDCRNDFLPNLRLDRFQTIFELVPGSVDLCISGTPSPPAPRPSPEIEQPPKSPDTVVARIARTVTEIVGGDLIPSDILWSIRQEFLEEEVLTPPSPDTIRLPSISNRQPRGLYEGVADLNGIVIPILFRRQVFSDTWETGPEEEAICRSLHDALQHWEDHKNLKFRRRQLQEFDWLKPPTIRRILERMRDGMRESGCTPTACQYERPIRSEILDKDQILEIEGRVDIYCPSTDTLIEIKTGGVLTTNHLLQTALYGVLMSIENETLPRMIVMNPCTQETLLVRLRKTPEEFFARLIDAL